MIRGPGLSTTGGLAASSTWCCHASVNFLIYKVTREKNTVTIRNIERLVGGGGGTYVVVVIVLRLILT